jgi:hypothetical protein
VRNVIGPQKTIAVASANRNHGGLTPAAPGLCIRQPPDNVRFSRHGVRFTEPRRADTRRSWLCIRQPPDNVRFSRHGVGSPTHGGLTPAALAFASRRTMRFVHITDPNGALHRKWVQRTNVVHQERLA